MLGQGAPPPLAAFVPQALRQALHIDAGGAPPSAGEAEASELEVDPQQCSFRTYEAVLLVADLSGFSALASRLVADANAGPPPQLRARRVSELGDPDAEPGMPTSGQDDSDSDDEASSRSSDSVANGGNEDEKRRRRRRQSREMVRERERMKRERERWAADHLSRKVNEVLADMLAIAAEYEMDAIKFAGDAITLMKPYAGGSSARADEAASAALECAARLLKAVSNSVHFSLHCALGMGTVLELHAGLPSRREMVLLGLPVKQVSDGIGLSKSGQVAVHANTFLRISIWRCLAWKQDGADRKFHIVQLDDDDLLSSQLFSRERPPAARSPPSASALALGLAMGSAAGLRLCPYVPEEVLQLLQGNPMSTFWSELRTISAAFVQVPLPFDVARAVAVWTESRRSRSRRASEANGTPVFDLSGPADAEEAPASLRTLGAASDPFGVLDACIREVQSAVADTEGSFRQFLVDDKGATAFATWGVSQAHTDDGERAVSAAIRIRDALARIGTGAVAIGITSGRVYCGLIGNAARADYTVLGDPINMASRLMGLGRGIVVDRATVAALPQPEPFLVTPLGTVAVKGKEEGIEAFRVEGLAQRSSLASRLLATLSSSGAGAGGGEADAPRGSRVRRRSSFASVEGAQGRASMARRVSLAPPQQPDLPSSGIDIAAAAARRSSTGMGHGDSLGAEAAPRLLFSAPTPSSRSRSRASLTLAEPQPEPEEPCAACDELEGVRAVPVVLSPAHRSSSPMLRVSSPELEDLEGADLRGPHPLSPPLASAPQPWRFPPGCGDHWDESGGPRRLDGGGGVASGFGVDLRLDVDEPESGTSACCAAEALSPGALPSLPSDDAEASAAGSRASLALAYHETASQADFFSSPARGLGSLQSRGSADDILAATETEPRSSLSSRRPSRALPPPPGPRPRSLSRQINGKVFLRNSDAHRFEHSHARAGAVLFGAGRSWSPLAPADGFVGRHAELHAIEDFVLSCERLRPHLASGAPPPPITAPAAASPHVLFIEGEGGVGKSALASLAAAWLSSVSRLRLVFVGGRLAAPAEAGEPGLEEPAPFHAFRAALVDLLGLKPVLAAIAAALYGRSGAGPDAAPPGPDSASPTSRDPLGAGSRFLPPRRLTAPSAHAGADGAASSSRKGAGAGRGDEGDLYWDRARELDRQFRHDVLRSVIEALFRLDTGLAIHAEALCAILQLFALRTAGNLGTDPPSSADDSIANATTVDEAGSRKKQLQIVLGVLPVERVSSHSPLPVERVSSHLGGQGEQQKGSLLSLVSSGDSGGGSAHHSGKAWAAPASRDGGDLHVQPDGAQARGAGAGEGAGRGGLFGFLHGATRDILYARLTEERRRLLHLRAAAALDALDPAEREQMGVSATALAAHFNSAGVKERAVHFLTVAGQAAVQSGSLTKAIAALEDAVQLEDDVRAETSRPAPAPAPAGAARGAVAFAAGTGDDEEEAAGTHRSRGVASPNGTGGKARGFLRGLLSSGRGPDLADRSVRQVRPPPVPLAPSPHPRIPFALEVEAAAAGFRIRSNDSSRQGRMMEELARIAKHQRGGRGLQISALERRQVVMRGVLLARVYIMSGRLVASRRVLEQALEAWIRTKKLVRDASSSGVRRGGRPSAFAHLRAVLAAAGAVRAHRLSYPLATVSSLPSSISGGGAGRRASYQSGGCSLRFGCGGSAHAGSVWGSIRSGSLWSASVRGGSVFGSVRNGTVFNHADPLGGGEASGAPAAAGHGERRGSAGAVDARSAEAAVAAPATQGRFDDVGDGARRAPVHAHFDASLGADCTEEGCRDEALALYERVLRHAGENARAARVAVARWTMLSPQADVARRAEAAARAASALDWVGGRLAAAAAARVRALSGDLMHVLAAHKEREIIHKAGVLEEEAHAAVGRGRVEAAVVAARQGHLLAQQLIAEPMPSCSRAVSHSYSTLGLLLMEAAALFHGGRLRECSEAVRELKWLASSAPSQPHLCWAALLRAQLQMLTSLAEEAVSTAEHALVLAKTCDMSGHGHRDAHQSGRKSGAKLVFETGLLVERRAAAALLSRAVCQAGSGPGAEEAALKEALEGPESYLRAAGGGDGLDAPLETPSPSPTAATPTRRWATRRRRRAARGSAASSRAGPGAGPAAPGAALAGSALRGGDAGPAGPVRAAAGAAGGGAGRGGQRRLLEAAALVQRAVWEREFEGRPEAAARLALRALVAAREAGLAAWEARALEELAALEPDAAQARELLDRSRLLLSVSVM
eukprot:tig00000737_g3793.t1